MLNVKKNLAVVCQNRKLPFIFEEAEKLGIEITFFYNSEECAPASLPAVKYSVALPLFSDEDEALKTMEDQYKLHPFDGIITLFEPALNFASKAARKLKIPYLSENVIENCRNKNLTRRIMHEHGLNTPTFIELREEEIPEKASLKFPLVVKPTNGFSSQGIIRVDDYENLVEAIKKVWEINHKELGKFVYGKGGVILESFIDGPEFAIETLSSNGVVTVLSVGDKGDCKGPYFEEGIYISPANIDNELRQNICDEVRRVVLALGITEGPAHVELRIDSNKKPYVIEVAPRIGGSGISHFIVKASTGINFLQLAMRQALNMPQPELPDHVLSQHTAGNYIIPLQGDGIFKEIEGITEVNEMKETKRIFQFIEPGTKILPYPHFSGYPGFILTQHDNHQECVKFHEYLDKNLSVVYQ
ncbi:ATP-grasp domain-containing protein [Pantoea anthophila]|uniref:ATP-grasp domain-containing protein n=1 Tax=Pantoea anthophila TaxID=470931 RepID=UPI000614CA17|nr:ATP-grasp domain-containing protein [Pantoea anthophila]KKB04127.1 phosphoribosylglycinamide synthetase [Pantoea anthophila]